MYSDGSFICTLKYILNDDDHIWWATSEWTQSEYDKHNVTFILTIDAISLAIHCTHMKVRLFVTLMQNEANLFLQENNDNF